MRLRTGIALARVRASRNVFDEGSMLHVGFNGRKLRFKVPDDDLLRESLYNEVREQFIENQYGRLNVRNRKVVDIGGGCADTAIYFVARGALHVYSYEPDKPSYENGKANIRLNGMGKKITFVNSRYGGAKMRAKGTVLKMDCEGCEYEYLRDFIGYDELILEFHANPNELVRMLANSGYKVEVAGTLLYAKRWRALPTL